jgi:ribokinase
MHDVITFGSATRDVFLRSKAMELRKEHGTVEACFKFGAKLNVEEIVFETGGGGTNNAVTFSRLARMRVAAVTDVGDDLAGSDVIAALDRDGVDTRFVKRHHGLKTAYSTVLLSGAAERTILTYRGAAALTDHRHIPLTKMKARLFHISNLSGDLTFLSAILAQAQKIGAKAFMNPGSDELRRPKSKLLPLLRQLDMLFLNRDEASALTGLPFGNLKGIVSALRKITGHAVMTDGRDGAYAITAHDLLHSEIVPAARINLTGAGDAFSSAYAAAILAHRDIRSALAIGTLNAAGVVQHTGAKVGIRRGWPSVHEIAKVKIKKVII